MGVGIVISACIVCFLCMTATAQEQRVALVIGNGQYQHNATLVNPPNDASDMAAALKLDGFTVTLLTDASRVDMEQAVRAFGNSLKNPDTIGMFYYSGHGAQADGANFLIPVDADIQNQDELAYNAVDVESILAKMRSAGNKINIVVLDACRDNPFPGSSRSLDKGLAVVKVKVPESVIVYATDPGSTALDGTGRNSPFTKAFLENMETPDQDITVMMKRVTSRVQNDTDGKQTPWVSTNLTKDFSFKSTFGASASTSSQQVATPTMSVTRSYGSLVVTAVTEGNLYLDGKAMGNIPAGATAKLDSVEVGSRSLELRYTDGQVERQDVTVEPGNAATVTFVYQKETPKIQVEKAETVTPQTEPDMSIWQELGSEGSGTIRFERPSSCAIDSNGHIYIADSGNKRIVRVDDMSGTNWTTSYAVSSGANAVAVNLSGQIFISISGDGGNQIVRMDDMSATNLTTLSSLGSGDDLFNKPYGIAVDTSGYVYIVDSLNNRIVRMGDMTGANWNTLGISGSDTNQLNDPYGVAVDSTGHIYISDSRNSRIIRVDDMEGTNWITLGNLGSGVNQFFLPEGIAVDSNGRIYIADYGNNRIVRMEDMHGTNWITIGSLGSETNQFSGPVGVALDDRGHVYVVDSGNNRIVSFTAP
jgi:uncharacterized caspase-like protein/streptogramin lyase